MSMPVWVAEAADMFWAAAGDPEPFPRDLRRAIARALPLTVVFMPLLSVRSAEEWLLRQGGLQVVAIQNRPLRACLICRFGHGVIFVDGTDAVAEQRFSIAHELAHFLLDYHLPRLRSVRRLGAGVLEVLDGLRVQGTDEQVAGLLAHVDVRAHVHLMHRVADGSAHVTVDAAERAADRLAFELLAPWAMVNREMQRLGLAEDRHAVADLLQRQYDIPLGPAQRYADCLIPEPPPGSALLRSLREHLRSVELSEAQSEYKAGAKP